ncbi:MAG: hypothetical protein JXQ83_04775 [Candidatus Glassbacteria bacterium]|nr:hypothetical protein [Candidatus Glassbacteria bacterium]
MECPWCAMEIERGLDECPFCKNPVRVGSKGRSTAFKVLAVLALLGFTALLLGTALPVLLHWLLHH